MRFIACATGCESYDKSDGKSLWTLCDKLYSYFLRLG